MSGPCKITAEVERPRLEDWLRHARGTDLDLFPLSDWKMDVENGDTRLGAEEWWEGQLEQQLDENEFAPIFERIRAMPADAAGTDEASAAFGHDAKFVSTLLERQIVLFSPDDLIGEGFRDRLEGLREAFDDLHGQSALPAELRVIAEEIEADIASAFAGPAPWLANESLSPV